MRIKHISGGKEVERDGVPVSSFILTNKDGDYAWIENSPKSRYQGWFIRKDDGLHRIIESIKIEDSSPVSKITNGFEYAELERENLTERYFLPSFSHSLVYELNENRRVSVFFDVHHSYSNDKGADFTFKRIGDVLLLSFNDGTYVAIRARESEVYKETTQRYYSYDKERLSPPYKRDIRLVLSLQGKRFVISAGETEEDAVREVQKIFVRNSVSDSSDIYRLCAKRTLSDLLVLSKPGLYAGLPWFFQFWPRDEAISLKSLIDIEPQAAKSIFYRILNSAINFGPMGAVNTDASGWVIKRAEDFVEHFSEDEIQKIKRELKRHIEELLWSYTKEGFAINSKRGTWMDTLDRDGARIEMQALRLNMYRFAEKLSTRKKEKLLYKNMEKEMRKKVRKKFFDGENLFDGYYPSLDITDKTIRPNIFLANYIYPHLLKKSEWIKCFDNALRDLYLSWGGISTVSKKDELFKANHTGEQPDSYHNGDSWFYINNIAAICLYRTDKKRYSNYIKKILTSSKEEIAFMGVIGRSAEVSSAERLSSQGSPFQAWSAATYLEASKEIEI